MVHNSQFFKRLVCPYFIIIAIVLFISTCVVYYASTERVKNNAFDNGIQIAEKTAQQICTYIDEMDLLAAQVNSQPEIMSIMYSLDSDGDMSNYFDKNVLTGIDISSKLKNLLIEREETHSIVIYNGNGDFISSREYMVDKKTLPDKIAGADYQTKLNMLSSNDGRIVSPPERDRWCIGGEQYVTVTRELKNEYSGNTYGIVEVRCSIERISAAMRGSGSGLKVGLFGKNTGALIYSENEMGTDYFSRSYADIENAPWRVIVETTNPVNKTYRMQILLVLGIVYIIMLVLMFVITVLIGRNVTRPIRELTEHVRGIRTTDERLNLRVEGPDEMRELERSFDKMLERLEESLKQEKKAYSLALQAQMNPHFLYNTLAVISSAGAEHECYEVENMCIELSDMLRYITAYEKVSVPLEEEAEHTKNYLSLMKARYEDLFSYDITIDEDLKKMTVPKLCIQPLVENCFSHGFKEKEPPWHISISMRGTLSRWELIIRDNGTGISQEQIDEIDERIKTVLRKKLPAGMGGLGVASAIVRFKLTNNENISYKIFNDEGMVIVVRSGREDISP